MSISSQLLFFFSALGAFNGLLLAVYLLFFLRPARLSNRLLGFLLLALSVRIGKSVFLFFHADLALVFLQLGLTACFFIGPLLWAYLKAARDGLEKMPTAWWIGFGTLALIILGIGWWRPYTTYPAFWRGGFIRYGIYNVWAIGLLAGGWVLLPVIRQQKWSTIEIWWINIFFGNLIVHLAYRYGVYTSYIVGALTFSCVFYLLALWFFLQRREAGFLVAERPKYGDKRIGEKEARDLLARCNAVMEKERRYLDPSFKLADLAAAAGSTPHQVSQLLNDNLDQSFAGYLRAFRIRHAQSQILTEEHLTLEAIGEEAGFGSKSTFYAAFREVTGTTPAQYRKAALENLRADS